MTAARGGRQRLPPLWLVLTGVIPFALVILPVGYVAISAMEAGPSGILSDLIRPYTLNLLVNTLVLSVSVTFCAGAAVETAPETAVTTTASAV